MVSTFLVSSFWRLCRHPLQILWGSFDVAKVLLDDSVEVLGLGAGSGAQEVQLLPGTGGWGGGLSAGGEGLGL